MRKYFYIFKNSWQTTLEYRADFLLDFFVALLPIIAMVFLWINVYSAGKNLAAYSLSGLLTYYLFGILLNYILIRNVRWNISDAIRTGRLSTLLMRPLSFFGFNLATTLAKVSLNLTVVILIVFFIGIFFSNFFSLTTSLPNFSLFVVSLVLAFLLNFLFNIFLGYLAFWIQHSGGITYTFGMVSSFFAGFTLPLDALPIFLQNMAAVLPFQYFFFFPLKLFLGQLATPEIMRGFFMQIIWLFVFVVLQKKIWQRGLAQYESTGN